MNHKAWGKLREDEQRYLTINALRKLNDLATF